MQGCLAAAADRATIASCCRAAVWLSIATHSTAAHSNNARPLPTTHHCAELFWLGAAAEFVERWEAAEQHADPQRLLLSVLVQAQQAACSDVRGTVERHLRRPPQAR